MIKTITPNEIILNIYNETSELEQGEFLVECLTNALLSEQKEEMEDMKNTLDSALVQPRKKSIDAILNYSASFMTTQ